MKPSRKIISVPISAINVLNPRERNRARFKELVRSVSKLGLKRPITVSKRGRSGAYELACGEGRMEAFIALRQTEIPAILVDASTEECILMSLIENIARRRHSPAELVGEIGRLAKHYRPADIAAKLDLSQEYVRAITYLLKHGEDRLVSAVERGIVPPTLAIEIARPRARKCKAPCWKLM
jgi:ParB family transcriptional regulator, chromosome partitioning protein